MTTLNDHEGDGSDVDNTNTKSAGVSWQVDSTSTLGNGKLYALKPWVYILYRS